MRESLGVSMANLNGLLNLKTSSNQELFIATNTTAAFKDAKLVLQEGDKTIWEQTINIAPDQPFSETIQTATAFQEENLQLSLFTKNNELLIDYQTIVKDENK
ncbi:MAG: hypothetical protein AAF599_04375, partial [Bacteroidota bacterium]